MKYPATFTPDTGGFVVTFRDIPEAITQGDDEADALFMARDVLLVCIGMYIGDGRDIPAPSEPLPGERMIGWPASAEAKILLLKELAAQKVRPADLARLLSMKPQEVNRMLNLSHATKIDQIEEALAALGKRLVLSVAG